GDQGGTSFLVLQFLEGETLEQRLKNGAVPFERALHYAIQLADALARAHRAGIVHRDLKPGNVMLTRDGVKLLDFGLARRAALLTGGLPASGTDSTELLTAEGTILGTLHYMAPEQVEGRLVDQRADLYALGV